MSIVKQILLSLVVLLVAGGIYVFYERQDIVFGGAPAEGGARDRAASGAPGGQGFGNQRGADAVLVVTAPVEIDSTGRQIRAIGTTAAARSVTLFPQVNGIVAEVAFPPGGEVDDGDVLIQLESDEEQVAVDRAMIALESAQQTVDRAERLSQSGSVTAVTLSDARTADRAAEIDLKSAQIELAKRTIRAPFAGVIGLTDLSVGDYVTSSREIATLDDMSTVTVAFDVPENAAGQIALGLAVEAITGALPGAVLTGEISAIDSRIDAATRTLRLEAAISNDSNALKPGMAVTITMSIAGEPRPAVPSLAIQWDRQGAFVWKLKDGTVQRSPVQIVARRSGNVIVAGDLAAGDDVVVEGVLRLREGMAVTRAEESAGPPGQPARPETESPEIPLGGGGSAAEAGRTG